MPETIQKNIQIKVHNGSDWELLFPKSKASLIESLDGKSVEEKLASIISDLDTKAAKDLATALKEGLMSSVDKAKLDAIEAEANKYVHPDKHDPAIIEQDASNRFVTDAEKATWSAKQDALGFTPEDVAKKGVASGYASLDENAKVPLTQIPDTARQTTHVVSDSTERSALEGMIAGEKAYETTTGDSYIWDGATWKILAKAEWENINLKWSAIDGKPTSLVADIDTAVTNSHVHANKAILDAIEEAFTTVLKTKLDGIEEGANKYVHPETHAPEIIAETDAKQFVSKADKEKWDRGDSVTVSAEAPTDAQGGDLWYEVV